MPGRLFRALLMLLPAEFRADYGRGGRKNGVGWKPHDRIRSGNRI